MQGGTHLTIFQVVTSSTCSPLAARIYCNPLAGKRLRATKKLHCEM